jgi:hypothetical protein
MKGGITSGVVYPLAVVELALKHRFACIGGTSAGAMAAAATAAAEYGRATPQGGFVRLAQVPAEVGPSLLTLFQPTPVLRPLFGIFLALLRGRSGAGRAARAVGAALRGYWVSATTGALPGVALMLWAALSGGASAGRAGLAGALLAAVGVVAALGLRLTRALGKELPGNHFGLCPGTMQPGGAGPGFTDWLADLIDEAAGLKRPGESGGPCLTFGHLAAPAGTEGAGAGGLPSISP